VTQQTVEIRAELLKKIGEGYNRAEIIKYLSEKFGVSKADGYYHYSCINKWKDQYGAFDKDLLFNVKARYNHIYKEASFQYLHCNSDNARIGYLRTMLEAIGHLAAYLPKDQAAHDIGQIRVVFGESP
jgi:hypothetical protein